MRLTALKPDNYIAIDGEGYLHADLSRLPENFHALQWYDTEGEIEWSVPHPYKLIMASNEHITSLDGYEWLLDEWQATKDRHARANEAAVQGADADVLNAILHGTTEG